jgi:predicted RNA binding protein YcfA (HicA-like mRNA interferase family)
MTRLPRPTGQEAVDALTRAGFRKMRQRGSHVFLKHPEGRATVVPIHSGEVLGPGIVSKILRDTELSRDEFYRLLR